MFRAGKSGHTVSECLLETAGLGGWRGSGYGCGVSLESGRNVLKPHVAMGAQLCEYSRSAERTVHSVWVSYTACGSQLIKAVKNKTKQILRVNVSLVNKWMKKNYF